MLGAQPQNVPEPVARVDLDPVQLILNASGPVFVVVWLLIGASALVWLIAVLKGLQLRRWTSTEQKFERELAGAREPEAMEEVAERHRNAPGARVLAELTRHLGEPRVLAASAKGALVAEQQRASTLMPTLASIGSASPFVGLFGTVYGIMDAFLRIGREKSASLPVVAPAIGEALIATAIGLFAAIPAVVAYNAIAKRMDDQLSALEAAAEGWVERLLPAAEEAAAELQQKKDKAKAAAERLAEAAGPRFSAAKGGAETALQGSGSTAATVPAMRGMRPVITEGPSLSDDQDFDSRATQPRGQQASAPPPLPKS